MTIYRPYQTEPHGMPLQFRDSTGEWHLFGAQWFSRNSEHVVLDGDDTLTYRIVRI